jgi:xanthine/uracil permease
MTNSQSYLVVTATGVLCLFTSLVGFVGIVLNNRPLLAIYNVLMWPCFGMIAAIGYTAYRKAKWNIEVIYLTSWIGINLI